MCRRELYKTDDRGGINRYQSVISPFIIAVVKYDHGIFYGVFWSVSLKVTCAGILTRDIAIPLRRNTFFYWNIIDGQVD
jgi:hypothetical protein